MKKITNVFSALVGASVLLTGAAQAQEDPFSTVITPAFSPITWERLVDARNEPQNWLMYSGTLDSQRYSLLDSTEYVQEATNIREAGSFFSNKNFDATKFEAHKLTDK